MACPLTVFADELNFEKYSLVDQKEFSVESGRFHLAEFENADIEYKPTAFNNPPGQLISMRGPLKGSVLEPSELQNFQSSQARELSTAGKVGLAVLGAGVLVGLIFGIIFLTADSSS